MFGINKVVATRYAFPLKISSSQRYLTDSNGVPFLYNADTGWFIFDKVSMEEYDIYLDNRVSKDFNTIHIMAPWNHDVPNYYGEYPFLAHTDITKPNEAWWSLVDVFIQKAAERGILVNIVPLWLGYFGAEWFDVFMENEPAAYREFGRFLGERYRKFANIMWTIGGDHDPQDRISRLDALANGLKDANPEFILSAHTWENKSAMDQYGQFDWLDLNTVYTYFPEWNANTQVYALSLKEYGRRPEKPFVMIESGYENGVTGEISVAPYQVRREAYWSILSGSTGFAYGNSDIWPFNPRWKVALDDPGAFYQMHAFHVFSSYRWFDLVPDQDHNIVIEGYGTFNQDTSPGGDEYITAAGTADGLLAIIYIPSTGTDSRAFYINMSCFSSSFVEAKWYNPTDGSSKPIGNFQCTERKQLFTTPGDNGTSTNDWLLTLTRAGATLNNKSI